VVGRSHETVFAVWGEGYPSFGSGSVANGRVGFGEHYASSRNGCFAVCEELLYTF